MKKDTSKLTKIDMQGIVKWLANGNKESRCPFTSRRIEHYLEPRACIDTCYSIFPSLLATYRCPCSALSASHIIKTFRKIVKEKS